MFRKVLVANRGEIAVRILRALREMDIRSVAVYSEADRASLHTRYADEAVCVGPAPSADSYLRVDRILDAMKVTGAEAVHPGYGFLSENAGFARSVADAGLTFIGPSPQSIGAMGSKTAARALMQKAGVPLIPGTVDALRDADEAQAVADSIGYPVTLKASAGGGGKGMRRVDRSEDVAGAFRQARGEAEAAFGDGSMYVEKYLVNPRHVEIQVLGDRHGNLIHLGERDCSVQRRHQKVIEESPCPVMTPALRAAMGEAAVQAARSVDYYSAGTVEFLLDTDGRFYFMEMNTRLQVEHPVTEMVTGVDLVKAMVRIAAGEPLALKQEDVVMRGHAIQCRIYAEDPYRNFMPSPGVVRGLRLPGGAGVRDDGSVYPGVEISRYYDPLISKLVCYGADRRAAVETMRRALLEYQVRGVTTNLEFHRRVMEEPSFVSGDYSTAYVGRVMDAGLMRHTGSHHDQALAAAAIHRFLSDRRTLPFPEDDGLSPWGAFRRRALRSR